jgi:hypothetical protein
VSASFMGGTDIPGAAAGVWSPSGGHTGVGPARH